MTLLFISDLHLCPTRPEVTRYFIHFLRHEAAHADKLYILGDLFEFWIGDDDDSPFNQQITNALAELTQEGVKCYFIQGNRDFLLNKRFCEKTGITLLDDHTVITIDNQRVLIMHGDTLCIDDVDYQKFRAKVHRPWLQWLFNHIPLSIRRWVVKRIQNNIQTKKTHKDLSIMDVTQSEVEKMMQQQQVHLLIHGHTHRPNTHQFDLDGQMMTRIVLGDWYTQGSVLKYQNGKYELLNRDFTINEKTH